MVNQYKSDAPKTRAKPYDRHHSYYIYRRLYTSPPLQQLMARYVKKHEDLIISFTQTDKDYIKYKVCGLNPILRTTFDERYKAAQESERQMIVASVGSYTGKEEENFGNAYKKLIELGAQTIPLYIAKLIDRDFLAYEGYIEVQANRELWVRYGPPSTYLMLQSVALWLDSQQQDVEKFQEKMLAGEVVSC